MEEDCKGGVSYDTISLLSGAAGAEEGEEAREVGPKGRWAVHCGGS